MKKFLSLLLFLLAVPFVLSAQDTIVKKNGDVMLCKILKEDSTSVFFTSINNGQYTNSSIDKSDVRSVRYGEVRRVNSSLVDNITLGIGFGHEYGGIGANIIVYPQKNVGLFAGIGYPLAGLGYNAGVKMRMVPKKISGFSPYFVAMYGYNAAVYVENAEEFNKIFYGPTFGAGVDIRSGLSNNNLYSSITLTIPIRNSEVQDYLDFLVNDHGAEMKNKLLPIGFSIGGIIVLNRIKKP